MIASALLLLTTLVPSPIEVKLAELERTNKCEIGAAIITPTETHFSRKNERFSLQSVMKMVVSMTALDLVVSGKWKLNQDFTFRYSDLSISHQPLSDELGNRSSMTVTLDQLIELSTTQSCSASVDFMIRKMGGTKVVNEFLKKHDIKGMSVDREERELQTNVVGLTWKPEFVHINKLEAAKKQISEDEQHNAYRRYQIDPRDTTTPAAMADLLQKLVEGKLLSPEHTAYFMGVMERTQTGPDRLKAGVPEGWILGHKTGTSSRSRGIAWATNDVGYVRNQNGEWKIIVALIRNSKQTYEIREATIRQVAKAAFLSD